KHAKRVLTKPVSDAGSRIADPAGVPAMSQRVERDVANALRARVDVLDPAAVDDFAEVRGELVRLPRREDGGAVDRQRSAAAGRDEPGSSPPDPAIPGLREQRV